MNNLSLIDKIFLALIGTCTLTVLAISIVLLGVAIRSVINLSC
jgi:hypothetical protein